MGIFRKSPLRRLNELDRSLDVESDQGWKVISLPINAIFAIEPEDVKNILSSKPGKKK